MVSDWILRKMVDEERYCVDILLQLASAQAALSSVGSMVFEAHMDTCVRRALQTGDPEVAQASIDEVLGVLKRYSGLLRHAIR